MFYISEIASTPKASDHNTWREEESPSSIDLAPSPIPFICTQDGQQGDIDVVWNYYSPKSKKHKTESETPIRKKRRKLAITDFSPIPKFPLRKRTLNEKLKRQEFLKNLEEELTLFNKNVQKLISSKAAEKIKPSLDFPALNNEENIFENSLCDDVLPDVPTSIKKNLCEQVLQRESDSLIESDDSINEYLLKASQAIEEKIIEPKPSLTNHKKITKKRESRLGQEKSSPPLMCNDSFDNIISMMNEKDIEMISSQANKINPQNVVLLKSAHTGNALRSDNTAFKNISNNFNTSTDTPKNKFTRYNSMPMAQNNDNIQKSSATLIRHKTMPFHKSESPKKVDDRKFHLFFYCFSNCMYTYYLVLDLYYVFIVDVSRQGCSQEEIRRKREAAREKLLAKKREQQSINCNINRYNNNNIPGLHSPNKKICLNQNEAGKHDVLIKRNFDSKMSLYSLNSKNCDMSKVNNTKENDIKKEIERKRLEALQKLQKKKWLGVTR